MLKLSQRSQIGANGTESHGQVSPSGLGLAKGDLIYFSARPCRFDLNVDKVEVYGATAVTPAVCKIHVRFRVVSSEISPHGDPSAKPSTYDACIFEGSFEHEGCPPPSTRVCSNTYLRVLRM